MPPAPLETPLVPPATSALRLHWFNIAQAGIEPYAHHIDVPFHQAFPFLLIMPLFVSTSDTNILYQFGSRTIVLLIVRFL